MRALFLDGSPDLVAALDRVRRPTDPDLTVNIQAYVGPEDVLRLSAGFDIVLDDHTALPTDVAARLPSLRHVIFLGTGARSYMDVEALAERGIRVHTIRGYGDTAVAEHSIALMWAAARDIALMDRGVRAGLWRRRPGIQLTGRTLGVIGFGGIGSEVARIAKGSGMTVLAWNRTSRSSSHARFVELETLLRESHVVSLHLLLTPQTRGFLSAERIALLRPGAILVNTARAGLVDGPALQDALQAGHLRHAALDVFDTEPLPAGDPLARREDVTLTAHSAFITPEASDAVMRSALDIAISIA